MTDNSIYFYNGRIALSMKTQKTGIELDSPTVFEDIFENAYEAVFNSIKYKDYHECIQDSTAFIKDVSENIYKHDNFDLVWEANPSSKEYADFAPSSTTHIKPWDPSEIVRFYTVPRDLDKDKPIVITVLMSIYGGNDLQNPVSAVKSTH